MMKIAILGSTGSIGTQTLDIVREQGDIQVTAIAAGSNIKKLEEQMRKLEQERSKAYAELADAGLFYKADNPYLEDAVKKAKEYLTEALRIKLDLGKGHGPVDHTLGGQHTAYFYN